MITPQRIQLSRAAGFHLQRYSLALNGLAAVKCDRTTPFGNPYRVGEVVDIKQVRRWGWHFSPQGRKIICVDAAEAERRFEHALIWDEAIHQYVREQLGGKNLACWCDLDAPCHCKPLMFVANSKPAEIHAIHRRVDAEIMRVAGEAL